MRVASGEYAHVVTLVRAPLSLDLTTMTVFCLRLFSTSHILRNVYVTNKSVGMNKKAYRMVESTELVMNN